MKKINSLLIVISLLFSYFTTTIMAVSINLPNNSAVILNSDFTSGSTANIIGSVYSANGNITFGQGDSYVNGDIVYNTSNKYTIPQYNNVKVTGKISSISETSFDYAIDDIKIPDTDVNIFNERNYDEKNNVFLANWQSTKSMTINKDTHFKGSLTLFEPLTIDTSKGDVYVKIDSLSLVNNDSNANNGSIDVVGSGKAYILVNVPGWGSLNAYVTQQNQNQTYLYVNGQNQKISSNNQSNIDANVIFVNVATSEWSPLSIGGKIKGDIITDADYVETDNSGTTVITGNLFATSAKKVTIRNNMFGNIVTDAANMQFTGGQAHVEGVVYAPLATVEISSTGNKGIYGQLIANKLNINSSGYIEYNQGNIDKFEGLYKEQVTPTPTIEPTVAPTLQPTIEPTAVPTLQPTTEPTVLPTEQPVQPPVITELIPSNDIPEGPQIELTTDSAYLYGYTDDWVGADEFITREEICALINRLLVQNDAREGFTKPSSSSYTDVGKSRWSFSAIEYMTYIGVYNSDDGSGSKRNISPNTYVTRGEVAKIVAFSLRLPYVDGDIGFPDISKDHKFYKYIKAMVDAGLYQGDNGYIKPDDSITRAEFVAMFNRIINRTEENGYIVTEADCPFVYNTITTPFLPLGTKDENGNEIGHWAFYEITRAASSFNSNKEVDQSMKVDRDWLDKQ